MDKKIIIFASLFAFFITVSGFYFGRFLKTGQNTAEAVLPTSTPVSVELLTWEDQSEFLFQYPKNLNLNPHSEDNENYAHLELTDKDNPGSVILWTKDTSYENLDDLIDGESLENYVGSRLDTFPAVKVINNTDKNKFTLEAIRNGYLYQIEVDTFGKGYWQKIFDSIVSSYKFIGSSEPKKINTGNSGIPVDTSGEIFLEEEVIE
ncbi:hypothetical protein A3D05_05385 [Candidatus Gottesmanbacteria bacterium RIFCSPHIGHO2_02_FULL_40_24]|uniref:Uncharacterized protein n=1 Tax=Candidatus Gottesmanbacteria bacterium RIFCSPHIGHO2_01_FULL_40_15 TaxID=1798376 RepID=A0A1F5Z6U4_9BACT|nr:MAG: hypothetical protein A2777_02020 [Candidatus Gottesmanbacteria bacterium RIFCSPHIGHO2_01_FULL_40_15]OGG16463.1 MAG: hypothetical protein A3D05_05385 [Candidatus Gottesmanbacteria bacterium RIFCSPHIGHO2_02_FULL_40_24]OGG22743.1 MAG: hypothetical protein A3B48_03015 [Candidatus Gottesmanbacteria bacterium RIFCSPLOWO2_01_FULL_40_10]OGG25576.1 MAG: hypothetical protein A3E42_04535 [Candidatus Gottesmanbacteria bacterium RIFCSPHIGHO2_12_FULL_40_13]OGG32582.1 MAG: hypothetical protein A3I80_0